MRGGRDGRGTRPLVGALAVTAALLGPGKTPAAESPRPAASPAADALARLDAVSSAGVAQGWRFREDGPGAADGAIEAAPWTAMPADNHVKNRGWFARWIEVPRRIGGYDVTGMRLWLVLRIDGEGQVPLTVYVDGHKASQVDDAMLLEPLLLSAAARPGQRLLIRARADLRGPSFIANARLVADRAAGTPSPRQLREDLAVASALIAAPGAPAGAAGTLAGAAAALQWGALARGDQAGFDRSVAAARERLAPLAKWMRSLRLVATGHSHIDMAWLWPWTETVDVVRRTFTTVLDLMRQYPDLVYAQSSAQPYAWMEEKYPDLFAQIRERVREGRWEPVGGMWVEPDLNLPDGESLARQLLYGQRYFIEKLGRPARIGWNPDSFGYSWQLPQLYRRAGIDTFITQKLQMNDTTPFPHKLFWWEAPDGSRVLTYLPHDAPLDGVDMAGDVAAHLRDTPFPEVLHLFGIGDHGGGPTRAMIEAAHGLAAPGALFPRLDIRPARTFFDDALRAAAAKGNGGPGALAIPVWRDEVYLQFHRGAYTTNGAVKRANRGAEALLLQAERFAALASLYGEPYPRQELADGWRKALFNQFHDILAGTGIAAVRVDAARDHADLRRLIEPVRRQALEALAARIDTRGAGTPVLVANPLPWERTETVEVEVPVQTDALAAQVTGPSATPAAAQVVARFPERHAARVRFLATAVPSLGTAVYHVAFGPRARAVAIAGGGVRARGGVLENDHLRVEIDLHTGCITSLRDKPAGVEVVPVGGCANALQAFEDRPAQWDAWNLDADYEKSPLPVDAPSEVELVESGPLRAAVRVVRRFRSSRFVQEIALAAAATRVDVITDADWHERHVVVKAAFPTTVTSEAATYEVPYGAIARPTTRRTPEERARFEVPALRWADLADARHGLLLMNDGKSGHDARDGVLRLTLLRGPTWPDPQVDEGPHRFTYALAPHAGDWRQAGAVRRGHELNQPLLALVVPPHPGTLPPRHAWASVTPDHVMLAVLKRAEDDDTIVLRLHETTGQKATAEVRLPAPIAAAEETDLLERRERPLAARGDVVSLPIGPHEIRTLRVRLAARGH